MKFKSVITGCLLILLLTELPFFSVLGVEHVLAKAETDGHHHSEFDLCDWLQIQTTGSLTFHIDLISPVLFGPSDKVLQATVIFDQQPQYIFESSSSSSLFLNSQDFNHSSLQRHSIGCPLVPSAERPTQGASMNSKGGI